jgi:hypothetical protein
VCCLHNISCNTDFCDANKLRTIMGFIKRITKGYSRGGMQNNVSFILNSKWLNIGLLLDRNWSLLWIKL